MGVVVVGLAGGPSRRRGSFGALVSRNKNKRGWHRIDDEVIVMQIVFPHP